MAIPNGRSRYDKTFNEKLYHINTMYLKWLDGYYNSKYQNNLILASVARVVKEKMLIDAELQTVLPNWNKYEGRVNDAIEIINNIEILLLNYKTNN